METIDKTVENAISRLNRLVDLPPTTVSEITITLVCPNCGTERERKEKERWGKNERRTLECDNCSTTRRVSKFNQTCPLLYQESEAIRLPQAQLRQVMDWTFGTKGLLLIGATGKGKSRIAWKLLRRVLCEDKPERAFLWFDCIGFGHEIARHYRLEDAEQWLDRVAETPLLYLDDLGKLKLTERAETELFGLIERRCANQLPMIVTTNDTGDSLAARMTENRGPALVRRLREFCHVITF